MRNFEKSGGLQISHFLKLSLIKITTVPLRNTCTCVIAICSHFERTVLAIHIFKCTYFSSDLSLDVFSKFVKYRNELLDF